MGSMKIWLEVCHKIHNDLKKFIFRNGSPFGTGGLFLEPAIAGGLSPHYRQKAHTDEDRKSAGFLWGVPKKRMSLEKRWCKQMGATNWYWKMFIPKYNIRICETCGHHYEAKHLCRNCYEKVKTETEEIRKQIETDIGNNIEDKGVIVLYQNEKELMKPSKELEGRMIVEVPKLRPAWFSTNLLQKTTAEPDPVTTTVTTTKPNLG